MLVLLTIANVLPIVGYRLELPATVVATTTNLPKALGLVARLTIAAAPVGSTVTVPTVTALGTKGGWNENVAPVKFDPVIASDNVLFDRLTFGVTEEITGLEVTTKFVLEVAVAPATVTAIGPVVALAGTFATSVVLLAEMTVAGSPLKNTVLAEGAGLKPSPRIVTTVDGPPWLGEKLKIFTDPGLSVICVMPSMFPAGS